jgi:signal transduction histidine kinase
MITLTKKIILAYTVVFGLALCGFAFVMYQTTKNAGLERLDSKLLFAAAEAQDEAEEAKSAERFPAERFAQAIRSGGIGDLRFRVVDRKGTVVAGDKDLLSSPIQGALEACNGNIQRNLVSVSGRAVRSLWAPIDINDTILYAVQLAAPPTDMEKELSRLRLLFVTGIPALLLLTGLAAFFITRSSFGPIRSMTETARSVTAGTLSMRLPVPGPKDEIRKLAETLNAMMERIDEAMRTQQRFVSDAAHELRTPLTVILGELEYAENRCPEEFQASIRTALNELQRFSRIIEGLLALARLDTAHPALVMRPVRLNELLVECVRHMRPAAIAGNIELNIHISEAVEIQGDQERLKSVFLNLIDNAIKYSPSHTGISIDLGIASTGLARVTIQDQGPGIAPADFPHIFKRFYRAESVRSSVSGSGLGLAIAEQVVKLHRGTITVDSNLNKGSTFVVELPRTPS